MSNVISRIGELYAHDVRAIRAVLGEIVTDHHEVDELVQDTFLRCVEKADTYNEEQSTLLTWCCNVAKNVAKNYLRDKDRLPEVFCEAELGLGVDDDGAVCYDEILGASDPCDHSELQVEAVDMYRHALRGMTRQMASCVEMRRTGYTNEEIADNLDTTEAVVRSQISQSKKYFE